MTIYKSALEQVNVQDLNFKQKERSVGPNLFSSSSLDGWIDDNGPNTSDEQFNELTDECFQQAFIAECEAQASRQKFRRDTSSDSEDERPQREREANHHTVIKLIRWCGKLRLQKQE